MPGGGSVRGGVSGGECQGLIVSGGGSIRG